MALPGGEEQQRAHFITQRLKALKKCPPELIPLGIVVGAAVGMAAYSLGRKLVVDSNLRLNRSEKKH
ncbi:hypothetical protein BJ508DRAFT_321193 [Ascobolus immersus RN42]|uniref:NADH-ubiquinone reductase complex 1 MLRQ subunit n=1 Tax=Ascobolus immersus RN42 TaxID=1160509 RepID=A0A3N4IRE2_ASCIM|nr:hypothetical protein BJ508DRAFT_321193 [Ascobolus immersus RN42]